MKKKHDYCKVCSRVRENCFYDYKKIENLIVTSDTEYLHLTSSDGVDLDVVVNGPSYFEYPDYELINGIVVNSRFSVMLEICLLDFLLFL